MALITKHFDICDLIDLVKIYPEPNTPMQEQTLSDVMNIVAAVILESDADDMKGVGGSSPVFGHFADAFNMRPCLDDVSIVLKKV